MFNINGNPRKFTKKCIRDELFIDGVKLGKAQITVKISFTPKLGAFWSFSLTFKILAYHCDYCTLVYCQLLARHLARNVSRLSIKMTLSQH